MATFNPLDAAQWRQWANDFDNTARLFQTQYAQLQQLAPYVRQRHPELLSSYNSLVTRGAQHQATLATLNQLRAQVGDWLAGIGQAVSGAVVASMDWLKQRFGLGGLGVAPLIAIAGIAAAAGAILVIANWIKESFEFSQRLNALYRLEATGQTPENAARIIGQTVGLPGQGGSFFGIPVNYIIIGVALVLLGPPLLNLLTEREKNRGAQ